MKCLYQNCQCRYQKDIGRNQTMQTKACEECELYSKDQVRVTYSCTEFAVTIVAIVILIIIILLL